MRLFLDNNEVFPDVDSPLKLCRENPAFSSSGDYTMEVRLSLDILDNRRFFRYAHRLDATGRQIHYQAKLLLGNTTVLQGSAKVTAISQQEVKVQLLGNKSELNSAVGDLYIDELDLPKIDGGLASTRTYSNKSRSSDS